MKIAVTGASGFVGSRLMSTLSERKIDSVGFYRRSGIARKHRLQNSIPIDYDDSVSLRNALEGSSTVVHLAGLAHQKINSIDDRRRLFSSNVQCLYQVCKAAKDSGVKKIIYISTVGVLGISTNGLPFDDTSPHKPHNDYSMSKCRAELLLCQFAKNSSLDYLILRPPLVYGARCPGNMAKLIKLLKILPFNPFGGSHNLRSLIYVDHLVDAIIVSALSPDLSGQCYLVSDGPSLHLSDIALALNEGLGKSKIPSINLNTPLMSPINSLLNKYEPYRHLKSELVIDSSRFCFEASWKPSICPIRALTMTASSFSGSFEW